ncbi:hypothetical protein [Streptomyces sp. NPDC020917]|uniref:hypothetical protein n=1 Tax=Streptomyces sp. NPDC020917 TaxID=3365102 RepID=UPI00378C959A
MFTTVVATSAAWALALNLSGYGQTSPPDLHHYRLSGSPCSGFTLKPLTDSFGTSHFDASPAVTRTSPVLDLAECTLTAQSTAATHWTTSYNAFVTVQLHKKTDPADEFDDLNGPHGPGRAPSGVVLDPTSRVAMSSAKTSVPVPGLGDQAYLLTGDSAGEETLTVLHGGAVLTIAVNVDQQWSGPEGIPPDSDGYPQKPPELSSRRPALVAAIRSLMSALSR